jgi:DeoR/GlpR family transcriptional regulator of sugar metabolism
LNAVVKEAWDLRVSARDRVEPPVVVHKVALDIGDLHVHARICPNKSRYVPMSIDFMQTPALSPEERQDAILALLSERPRVAVSELAALFSTSEDSIRRDLRQLEKDGRVRRVHGAVLPAAVAPPPFPARGGTNVEAKSRIAAAASPFLTDGMTVLVDGGTTTLAVVRAIPPDRRLTVVTPSLPAAEALADYPFVTVVVVGGVLDAPSRTTVGAAAVAALRAVRADLCLLGLCSIDPTAGITATGYEEAEVKRAMTESAAAVLAVATSDKLGFSSPFHVAPAAVAGRLVTDSAAPAAILRALAEAGVDITVA